jgi:hypothetical protein
MSDCLDGELIRIYSEETIQDPKPCRFETISGSVRKNDQAFDKTPGLIKADLRRGLGP